MISPSIRSCSTPSLISSSSRASAAAARMLTGLRISWAAVAMERRSRSASSLDSAWT